MANRKQLALLRQDVSRWNQWRRTNWNVKPNLSRADLSRADLRKANLSDANLSLTNFVGANLSGANLSGANLSAANLDLAELTGARLFMAKLPNAALTGARLVGARLMGADLSQADLLGADLTRATLIGANFNGAKLSQANLSAAACNNAVFERAALIETNLERANLTGARIYGIAAWDLRLAGAIQRDLIITPWYAENTMTITLDDMELAQFIYLLLHYDRIRNVINTITSKVVLILGRFTPERKAVLDALREELRRPPRDYVPIVFDFEKPANRDLTETVSTLAHMAKFVIADLTDATSVPQELGRIVPFLPSVPVQPIRLASKQEWAMYEHFPRFPWVLPVVTYETTAELLATLGERVIGPAERRLAEQVGGALSGKIKS